MWACAIIFRSAGSVKALGLITTISVLEPYTTVLSDAQAKILVSYQLGDGGISKEFIFYKILLSKLVKYTRTSLVVQVVKFQVKILFFDVILGDHVLLYRQNQDIYTGMSNE